jgi:hypothetical protein
MEGALVSLGEGLWRLSLLLLGAEGGATAALVACHNSYCSPRKPICVRHQRHK